MHVWVHECVCMRVGMQVCLCAMCVQVLSACTIWLCTQLSVCVYNCARAYAVHDYRLLQVAGMKKVGSVEVTLLWFIFVLSYLSCQFFFKHSSPLTPECIIMSIQCFIKIVLKAIFTKSLLAAIFGCMLAVTRDWHRCTLFSYNGFSLRGSAEQEESMHCVLNNSATSICLQSGRYLCSKLGFPRKWSKVSG